MARVTRKRRCRYCYYGRRTAGRWRCTREPPVRPRAGRRTVCECFRLAEDRPVEPGRWLRGEMVIFADRSGDYCRIPLTRGQFARVDPEDYPWLSQFRWHCQKRPHTCYAVRTLWVNGEACKVWMHREVMDTPARLVCDHINHDGLDNRRRNLRNCTKGQNNLNKPSYRNGESRYKGLWRRHGASRWHVSIQVGGHEKNLGVFDSEIDAARAYDEAARRLHGQYACLNDPDGPDVPAAGPDSSAPPQARSGRATRRRQRRTAARTRLHKRKHDPEHVTGGSSLVERKHGAAATRS